MTLLVLNNWAQIRIVICLILAYTVCSDFSVPQNYRVDIMYRGG